MTKSKTEPKKELSVMEQTVTTIQNMRTNLAQVLPPQINVDKFIRTATGAIQSNPDLLDADRKSLFMACQRAAQDGLILDGREAALVMFNTKDPNNQNKWIKKAQYMPMTAGILKKSRNSGEISTINAYVVYENDDFKYTLGLQPNIEHTPALEEPGDFRLVYAVAKLKDGSVQLEVMTKSQVEKVRKVSKSGSDNDGNPKGIWKQWYEEMARKTVLRRLCKYLPSSTDLDGVLAASDEHFAIRSTDDTPVAAAPAAKKTGNRMESAILDDDDVIDGQASVVSEPEHDDDPI